MTFPRRAPVAALAWLLIANSVWAQDSADDEGFAEVLPVTDATASTPVEPTSASVHLSGTVALDSAIRLNRRGAARWGKSRLVFAPELEIKRELASAATSLEILASGRAEADFAYLLRPEDYDAATMELYGSRLIIGPSYLRVATHHVELAFGEQIRNFGQGEVLSLLDLVNPRDLREPVFADLEQLRLPVLMTRVGLSFERAQGELLIVHEPYFGLLPPPTGEFSPLRKLLLGIPALNALLSERTLRYRHLPGRASLGWASTQLHGRITLRAPRADLSLQAASVLDALGVPSLADPQTWTETRIDLVTRHPRYAVFGHAGALTLGPVVVRWELGYESQRPFVLRSSGSGLSPFTSEPLSAVRGLLGLTYVPSGRTNLGVEALQSVVLDNPARRTGSDSELLFPVEATQLAFRASHRFLRDRAELTLIGLLIGVPRINAASERVELSYLPFDGVRISLGAVSYQPSQDFGPFYGFERNDRAYANLRWSFAAH